MLEKTMRMNYLYDFYQALLTPKQRNYMALYYLDDYSLGEIAEQYEVSRQAVYDNIRRTEAMLEQYEEKLGLLQKYERRQRLIGRLKDYVRQHYSADAELAALVNELDELD
ncbi:putative DNA-binding protein [Geobacillus subterraneus]|uniref:putative DNA-binding protein n=1 Tax=Geobacillus subterraneus TaxID=129338 RepID=UPI001442E261|nr:putative DNA-binding protein [Geobacillus subterraneus]QIZ67302.1 putative DNA-binding protein [Geobacillus subterraneus]WPZ19487.1 putative DNA-binding protein [Geobacillus subterraneus]